MGLKKIVLDPSPKYESKNKCVSKVIITNKKSIHVIGVIILFLSNQFGICYDITRNARSSFE